MSVPVLDDGEPRGVHTGRCAVWTSEDASCDCGAWSSLASCASLTPWQADQLFFGENPAQVAAAQEMCADCPVRRDCSTYADVAEGRTLSRYHLYGVWGGETAKARADRRRAER